MRLSKEQLSSIDNQFHKDEKHWLEHNDEESWHKMWNAVTFACENALKKRLHNVKLDNDDFNDYVVEMTSVIMARYLRPQKYFILSLSSAAYFASLRVLYNQQQQFNDKCISFEGYLETHNDNIFTTT